MSIKWKFIICGFCFYVAAALLLFRILEINKWYFVVAELFLLASLFMFISLYRQLIKPIETISSAINLLKEKDFSTRLKFVKQKEIDQLILVYNKMLEQLHNERVLHEEKNLFLDRLIDASPSAIFVLNDKNEIIRLNPAAHSLFSLAENVSIPLAISELPSPWPEKLSNLKSGDRVAVRIGAIRRFTASYNTFLNRGYAHPFIIIEEMTRELIMAERQSYEKVIRMMSHEVNNSVGAVNSVMQSVLSMSDQFNDDIRSDVSNALEVAMDRNYSMNRFMANFADVVKLPQPQLQQIDLSTIINRITDLFKVELNSRNILIQKKLVDCNILADSVQMEQLLVNIIKNSMEAIGSQGEIVIEIHKQPLVLSVTDNGEGFSELALDKLFTPFFSTKQKGQGIGLTLVREILLNHGFRFKLHRKQENITEFYIEF